MCFCELAFKLCRVACGSLHFILCGAMLVQFGVTMNPLSSFAVVLAAVMEEVCAAGGSNKNMV